MEPFIGTIILFAGNFAPRGWAFCAGQLLSIAQNSALFSILGTTYGGDGRTTFALPDLRGRVPVGIGQGPGLPAVDLGEQGGAATTTLLATNLPAHSHSFALAHAPADGKEAGYLASGEIYASAKNSVAPADTIGVAGNNAPVNNMQPYTGLNYIIALEGIYPSRS